MDEFDKLVELENTFYESIDELDKQYRMSSVNWMR